MTSKLLSELLPSLYLLDLALRSRSAEGFSKALDPGYQGLYRSAVRHRLLVQK